MSLLPVASLQLRAEEKAEYNLKTTECIFQLRPISVVDSDSAWIKKVATLFHDQCHE